MALVHVPAAVGTAPLGVVRRAFWLGWTAPVRYSFVPLEGDG